jgi:hypothetical protein
MEVYTHIFLTSALVTGEWSASRPVRFTPGEKVSGTHWIGGWVGPRAGLDYMEKIRDPNGTRTGRSARSQSLYRLTACWWCRNLFDPHCIPYPEKCQLGTMTRSYKTMVPEM